MGYLLLLHHPSPPLPQPQLPRAQLPSVQWLLLLLAPAHQSLTAMSSELATIAGSSAALPGAADQARRPTDANVAEREDELDNEGESLVFGVVDCPWGLFLLRVAFSFCFSLGILGEFGVCWGGGLHLEAMPIWPLPLRFFPLSG